MKIVSPEDFRQAFLAAAKPSEPQMLISWRDLVRGTQIASALYLAIAKELGLQLYPEYRKIDAVFYTEHHLNKSKSYPNPPKYIAIALEHEQNNRESHTDEMIKLQVFNAPLKVLITYPLVRKRHASRRLEPELQELLEKYASIVSAADVFSDFSTHRKQLVIFGIPKSDHVEWRFHVYQDGMFRQLES